MDQGAGPIALGNSVELPSLACMYASLARSNHAGTLTSGVLVPPVGWIEGPPPPPTLRISVEIDRLPIVSATYSSPKVVGSFCALASQPVRCHDAATSPIIIVYLFPKVVGSFCALATPISRRRARYNSSSRCNPRNPDNRGFVWTTVAQVPWVRSRRSHCFRLALAALCEQDPRDAIKHATNPDRYDPGVQP
jgi:hypothetical protein